MKYVLDKIIDEVWCDDSEVTKEILSGIVENLCKNAKERVVLVKDELQQ